MRAYIISRVVKWVIAVAVVAVAVWLVLTNPAVHSGFEAVTGLQIGTSANALSIGMAGREVTASTGEMPNGFPSSVPLYPDMTVKSSVVAGAGSAAGYQVTFVSDADAETVQAWYTAKLAKGGWKTTHSQQGARALTMDAAKGSLKVNVSIAPAAPTGGAIVSVSAGRTK